MRHGAAHNPRGELLRHVTGLDGEVEWKSSSSRSSTSRGRPLDPRRRRRSHHRHRERQRTGSSTPTSSGDRSQGGSPAGPIIAPARPCNSVAVAQAAHRIDPSAADASNLAIALGETIAWWERWSTATTMEFHAISSSGRTRVSAMTGAIIAAPTTSSCPRSSAVANWDYRYCWVRDTTLALQRRAGDGQGFRDFIMRSSAGHGAGDIMYSIFGERGAAGTGTRPRGMARVTPGAHRQRGGPPGADRRVRPSPRRCAPVAGPRERQ